VSTGTVLGRTVDSLRQVFTDVPQPVAVVTSLSLTGEPIGMTVSSLASASLSPALVLFCPATTSRTWGRARRRGCFAVNILRRQHSELALQFSGPGDRFAGVRTLLTEDGIPVLADALTALICDVRDEHPAGDHTVVVGRVRTIHTLCDGPALDTVSFRVERDKSSVTIPTSLRRTRSIDRTRFEHRLEGSSGS
jgi:3-hydroxy-9,10-secoandrosta-1,3,5(10)-triene-9,17-dione monooxygenase reductase component